MTVPHCYALTGLTRTAGANRRVVIQGFDLPFRGVVVAAAGFAVGVLPTIVAVLLVGSWGLVVMAAVQVAVFQLVEWRTRSGLHLRTYRAVLDRRSGTRTVGRFRCCGVTVDPAPSRFRVVTAASVPVAPAPGGSALDRVFDGEVNGASKVSAGRGVRRRR